MRLDGTVAIVTGASRGIGTFIAEELASRGARLALAARSPDGLERTAERVRGLGREAIVVPTDMASLDDLERLVDRTERELGTPGVLVNNAGREMVGYFETIDPRDIVDTVTTNLSGMLLLSRVVVPKMIEAGRGHICNVSSAAGKNARPYGVVYAATKHGVVGFSWSLRAELEPKGIEVSVVCPGYVSDVGMFADRTTPDQKPPATIGMVSPARVARATADAIEANRAEVVVGSPLLKTSDVFHAISPKLAIWTGRRSGMYSFLRKEATGDDPA